MKNAHMVFRHPGPHLVDGISYEYLIVEEEDVEAKVAEGWARSVPEAKALADTPTVSVAPPTREELEQKATELKIKFDGRTSDKKLSAAIEEAMKV